MNYFNAENLLLKRPWLLGSMMIMLNLLNMMAWSQHYFIHISFYIFLLALIAISILKDKTDDKDKIVKFHYFSLEYTWPNTEARELAYYRSTYTHMFCIQICPFAVGIYCSIMAEYFSSDLIIL